MKTNLPNSGKRGVGPTRESGGVLFWLVVIGVLFLLFVMTVGPGMVEPGFVLAFGWVQFIQRTISAISWNWDLVGMSIFTSIGILVLMHKLLGGIVDKVATIRNLPWRWSGRWTWAIFLGLLVLFTVGMAMGGIVHQLGWMMSTKEPMIEAKNRRWRDYANMKQLDMGIRTALKDAGGNLETMRRELRAERNGYVYESSGSMPMLQAYHVLLVMKDGKTVVGRIIFPREGQQREKAGGYFGFDGGELGLCPWPKLQEMVRTNSANLIAL